MGGGFDGCNDMSGVAYVFPGQGAQYVGMGADLFEQSEAARLVFASANEAFGDDLAGLCFHGPEEALRQTRVQQPAVVAVAIASLAAFNEVLGCAGVCQNDDYPIPVKVLAGHSLGLWAAVPAADVLSVQTAMEMVVLRGASMQSAAGRRPGGMSAVLGLEVEKLDKVVMEIRDRVPGSYLSVANVNSPAQVVVGGDLQSLLQLEQSARAAGARRVVSLEVAGAFHTVAMLPARDAMRERLFAVDLTDPVIPITANLDGRLLATVAELRTELAEHVAAPLQWWQGVRTMVGLGVSSIVEFGHQSLLTGMLRRTVQDVSLFNVYDAESAHAVAKELCDA